MSTDGITKGSTEVSPRLKARVAGVAYLMNFAFAPGMIAISKFVIPGEAAATATNFLAHEALFWLGFAGNLIAVAGYITGDYLLDTGLQSSCLKMHEWSHRDEMAMMLYS